MRTRFDSSNWQESLWTTLCAPVEFLKRNKLIAIVLLIVLIWLMGIAYYSSKSQKYTNIIPHIPHINDNNPNLDDFAPIIDKIPLNKPNDKQNDNSINNDKNPNIMNNEPNQMNKLNNNENIDIPTKVSNAKKIVITYGQNCCVSAKKRMCETAYSHGNADECYAYDATVMDAEFTEKNKKILTAGRGAGYWLWKPYIIYKHLTDDNLPEGSYIVYSDAGAKLIGDVKNVLEFMEQKDDIYKGVLFFGVGFDQKNFCKRDAFILQDCDREECYNAMQINAFVGFFRKCDYTRMVIKTWLDECQDGRILTDIPNTQGEPNLGGFRDHRHDQAAITNVMNAHHWNYDTTNGPVLDKVFLHDRFKG